MLNKDYDDRKFSMGKKLSDNAYQFVLNNMTWEKVIPKYIKFYNELLK